MSQFSVPLLHTCKHMGVFVGEMIARRFPHISHSYILNNFMVWRSGFGVLFHRMPVPCFMCRLQKRLCAFAGTFQSCASVSCAFLGMPYLQLLLWTRGSLGHRCKRSGTKAGSLIWVDCFVCGRSKTLWQCCPGFAVLEHWCFCHSTCLPCSQFASSFGVDYG